MAKVRPRTLTSVFSQFAKVSAIAMGHPWAFGAAGSTTISILHCSSAQALSHGYEAFPLFNDLINGFCRIFNHVFCEAS
jgi:hypothetical protein